MSGVIKSDKADDMSVAIARAFVAMRKFILNNASVFKRLDTIELKQLKTDEKLEQIFKALDAGQPQPEKGIFFEGQVFDAYVFVADIIKRANRSIILIDNFVDETVLSLLTKRSETVAATIYTKSISKQLQLDRDKHNAQYPPIDIQYFTPSHDRFLIIDNAEMYHLGASLKDLGKKWFAFSKMDSLTEDVLAKLKNNDMAWFLKTGNNVDERLDFSPVTFPFSDIFCRIHQLHLSPKQETMETNSTAEQSIDQQI